jgi:YafQ family addiction module toxin component
MYNYQISNQLLKDLVKLSKKNQKVYELVLKKIDEIRYADSIEHYKNLKHGLKELKRVHIGHYVLLFRYDKPTDTIVFESFKHHDKAYVR